MPDAFLFVLLSLSVYRVWRLIGKDDITAPLRAPLPAFLVKGIECPWCLGTWMSVAAVYGVDRNLVTLEPNWPIWAAAVACAVGLIGRLDDD